MSEKIFEVLRPGALTTIQDLGRFGHQRDGVSVCGSMDSFAAVSANILAGNRPNAALIEVTQIGPQLKAVQNAVIGLAGADLNARVGRDRVPPWSSRAIAAGEVISFGTRAFGNRAYLAVCGGIDVPVVLSSRSTDLKARIGGVFGRKLIAGDNLFIGSSSGEKRPQGRRALVTKDLARFRPDGEVRFMRNIGDRRITDEFLSEFLTKPFVVRPDSDRMGCRFETAPFKLQRDELMEDWSEPVTMGTIQLPPDGVPIILMADRQTVGGYPKVGTVISVDLWRIAQAVPGDALRLAEASLSTGQILLQEQSSYLDQLSAANM